MHNIQLNYYTRMTGKEMVMDSLFLMFLFQVVLCIILFSMIYRLIKKGSEIRKEIDLLRNTRGKEGEKAKCTRSSLE